MIGAAQDIKKNVTAFEAQPCHRCPLFLDTSNIN